MCLFQASKVSRIGCKANSQKVFFPGFPCFSHMNLSALNWVHGYIFAYGGCGCGFLCDSPEDVSRTATFLSVSVYGIYPLVYLVYLITGPMGGVMVKVGAPRSTPVMSPKSGPRKTRVNFFRRSLRCQPTFFLARVPIDTCKK